jgi:hypothetical protein
MRRAASRQPHDQNINKTVSANYISRRKPNFRRDLEDFVGIGMSTELPTG